MKIKFDTSTDIINSFPCENLNKQATVDCSKSNNTKLLQKASKFNLSGQNK